MLLPGLLQKQQEAFGLRVERNTCWENLCSRFSDFLHLSESRMVAELTLKRQLKTVYSSENNSILLRNARF